MIEVGEKIESGFGKYAEAVKVSDEAGRLEGINFVFHRPSPKNKVRAKVLLPSLPL